MVRIAAKEVTIKQLRESFGLEAARDVDFFREWRSPENELTQMECALLDRVRENFTSLMDDPPMLENTVKMVVVAPLLDLAGFYRKPFQLETEASVEIEAVDDGTVVRGRIDVLVVRPQLWLLVIESKRSDFSVTRGLPQALAYMLGSPNRSLPTFGMITNGNEFLFVKSMAQPISQYATSRLFSLINPHNELCDVLRILKTIGRDGEVA
jgi:predicted type IV restriction endonuclease